nr:S1 RNA-binding domain-containing protein [Streptomyces sp. SJL17-1]
MGMDMEMHWQSESPELWAFLESLDPGEILSGTVAAIERFGVFVALDDGPDHPTLPGVGFIVIPELSWRHFDAPTEVVEVGQRVACEFLQFDTYNAEARLSLKALQPDPLRAFADRTEVGQELRGTVDRVMPFGVFVDIGDGLVGLVPFEGIRIDGGQISGRAVAGAADAFPTCGEISVVVTAIERPQRRVRLALPRSPSPLQSR